MQGIFTRVFRRDSKSENVPAMEEGREEGMSSEVSHGYTTDEGSMEHREYKEERSRVSFDANMGVNLHGGDQIQMEGVELRMEPQTMGNKGEMEGELSQAENCSPSTHTTSSTPSGMRKSLIMPMVDFTQQNTWASHSSPVSSTPEGLGSSVISLEGQSPMEVEFRHLETVEETGVDNASEVASEDCQRTRSSFTVQARVNADDTEKLQQPLLDGELNLKFP